MARSAVFNAPHRAVLGVFVSEVRVRELEEKERKGECERTSAITTDSSHTYISYFHIQPNKFVIFASSLNRF